MSKSRRQYRKDPQNAFSGAGKPSSQDARIADLERTIGQLYLENSFLKKTVDHSEMLLQRNGRPKELA